jgi:hypothetical protein
MLLLLFFVAVLGGLIGSLAVHYHYITTERVNQIERDLIASIESEARHLHERLTSVEEDVKAATIDRVFGGTPSKK